MAGPIKKSDIIRRLTREARGALRLGPWLLLSLLLLLIFWQADSSALAGLFQSPPTDTPTVPATNTVAPMPTLPPTATPTQAITPTVAPPAGETPAPAPSDTPLAPPTLTLTPTPTLTPTQSLPAGEEALTPPAEGQEAAGDDRGRYPEGESGLNFEWGMLFDAVALGLSYGWLCCGGLIVLGVPLFFLVLWVASYNRRQQSE
ncbi:MAG: hypothetical protein P8129_09460 [Anaerolineae bacterium]|jgi:hypothetical protein